jgi:VWFA-related protein
MASEFGLGKASFYLLTIFTVFLLFATVGAQTPPAQQQEQPKSGDPNQEILKISTEEVRIPVFAFDGHGRFDPTVSVEDLLVRENGVAQVVTGVYRVPAYVLVLADTGGELNQLKTVKLTGSVAAKLVSELRSEDWIALMQVNSAAELIKTWTRDRPEAIRAIQTKLISAKRSNLIEGLIRASEYLRQTPAGNRHLVIISDGYQTPDEREALGKTIRDLASSGIAVHVISYTSISYKTPPIAHASAKSNVPEELAMTLPAMRSPTAYTPDMKDVVRARGAYAIDLDRLFRSKSDLKQEMARSETEFRDIAAETGGVAWLPTDAQEMLNEATAAAHDIDSQYVVAYKPRRPLSKAEPGEYRKLDVITRRVGLVVRSRRGYVVNAEPH